MDYILGALLGGLVAYVFILRDRIKTIRRLNGELSQAEINFLTGPSPHCCDDPDCERAS